MGAGRSPADAQTGIRAIAHCGGTVFAQDQETSAYSGMPGAAVGTGLVHAVLPPAEIAGPAGTTSAGTPSGV